MQIGIDSLAAAIFDPATGLTVFWFLTTRRVRSAFTGILQR